MANPETGCWEWIGTKAPFGHGVTRARRRSEMAHRAAYELLVGPIPAGLVLDHLCRVPACINPAHLEPVTRAENSRRGTAGALARERALAKTHCPQGHAYDEENTYRHPVDGKRHCRACNREKYRRQVRDSGREVGLRMEERTHCPAGHPLSGENLRQTERARVCRTCTRAQSKAWRERNPGR